MGLDHSPSTAFAEARSEALIATFVAAKVPDSFVPRCPCKACAKLREARQKLAKQRNAVKGIVQ